MRTRSRSVLAWGVLAAAVIVPIAVAATSEYLAYRSWIYIAAGFAGIGAMTLLLVQPLLAAGHLPGLSRQIGRRLHQWIGTMLVVLVVAHVGGLYLTSPPDVVDALLFASPTPFSAWGVIAMWALFAAAVLAAVQHPLRIRPRVWRFVHTALALLIVIGSIGHAMLIEGTMGTWSKSMLCVLVAAVFLKAVVDLRSWAALIRRAPNRSSGI